jgi:protein SCO1/2
MILRRSLLLPLSVFLAAALVLLATLLFLLPDAQRNAARVPIGGPFQLTSQEGKPFSSESLKASLSRSSSASPIARRSARRRSTT